MALSLSIPTYQQTLQNILNAYSAYLISIGQPVPPLNSGSPTYARFYAISQELYNAELNTSLSADAIMPDTAQDTDLVRIASNYGLSLNSASGSYGEIIVSVVISGSVLIPANSQLIDATGQTYQTSETGQYSNGSLIPIQSISVGASTNLASGTKLTWSLLPAYCSPTAIVSSSGLEGGSDIESYEGLRTRLFALLQNPPSGGNWAQVQNIAQNVLLPNGQSIQQAFVYPGFWGAGTLAVSVISALNGTSLARNFGGSAIGSVSTFANTSSSIILSSVFNAVSAELPGQVYCLVTSAQTINCDLSIGLSLTPNKNIKPNWVDQTPFPCANPNDGYGYCFIPHNISGAIYSATAFPIYCNPLSKNPIPLAYPSVNISWFSYNDLNVYSASGYLNGTPLATNIYQFYLNVGQSMTDSLGYYPSSSINSPYVPLLNGLPDFIFPEATNAGTSPTSSGYIPSLLSQIEQLGPGEILPPSSLSNLPFGVRQPAVNSGLWNANIDYTVLKPIEDDFAEIYQILFFYVTNFTNLGYGSYLSSLPSGTCPASLNTSNGPYILTVGRIGLYPL